MTAIGGALPWRRWRAIWPLECGAMTLSARNSVPSIIPACLATMEADVGRMSWAVLQRLFDDESPLRVWREERKLSLSDLAATTGLPPERLAALDEHWEAIADREVDRLSVALRIPMEFLFVPPQPEMAAE